MDEIWKDIVGYEGLYQISNLGNAKSLEIIKRYRYKKHYFHRFEKILKNKLRLGYYYVGLYKNYKLKNICVHILVAKAFIPNPENKPTVNHKDLNKLNNTVENLEWNTVRENIHHARDRGMYKNMEYSNRTRKLTKKQAEQIRILAKTTSNLDISKKYNVCETTIKRIVNNITYVHFM